MASPPPPFAITFLRAFQNLTKVPAIDLFFLSRYVGLLGKQIFLFREKLKILHIKKSSIVSQQSFMLIPRCVYVCAPVKVFVKTIDPSSSYLPFEITSMLSLSHFKD